MTARQNTDAAYAGLAMAVGVERDESTELVADLRTVQSQLVDRIAVQADEIARLQAIIDAANQPPAVGTLFGMSAPASQWDARVSEVGAGLKARRVFGSILGGNLDLVQDAHADGLLPVYSIKVPSWEAARDGQYDAQIGALADTLDGYGKDCAFTIHHEPSGDGNIDVWRDMLIHCLPLARRPHVKVGPVDNGWRWSAKSQGQTDAEIDATYTAELVGVCDFLAADCYHGGTMTNPKEDAGVKITRMAAYFDRRGIVLPLGLGEYNGITAEAIINAQTAITMRRFWFACIFNSSANNRDGVNWVLTGDRLAAFQDALNP